MIGYDTTKTRIQGNAVVVTIPKPLGVESGTKYRFSKEYDGALKVTLINKASETMAELLRDGMVNIKRQLICKIGIAMSGGRKVIVVSKNILSETSTFTCTI